MMAECVACGEDLSEKQSGRRALNSAGSVRVVQVWRDLLKKLGEERREEELLEAGCKIYMCRKCFSSYERYSKLGESIEEQLLSTLDSSRSKQKRSGSIQGTPKSKRFRHQESSKRSHHHYSSGHLDSSPSVSVHVGYKSPKRYILTPRRKRLGKAVARRFHSSVADECLKQSETRKVLFQKLVHLLRKDVKRMCSNEVSSVLQDKKAKALSDFTWQKLMVELAANAPTLLQVLQGCTFTRTPRKNRVATIGMCAAILLRFRHQRMNLVQRILSLILHAGHSAKLVYERLQKVNLVTSHRTATCLVKLIGADHDSLVKKWRDQLIEVLESKGSCDSGPITFGMLNLEEDGDKEDDDPYVEESSSSESDQSDVDTDTSDEDSVLSSMDEESESDSDATDDGLALTFEAKQSDDTGGDSPDNADSICTFTLCGDNLDKTVKVRFMRSDKGNLSLHYFHCYGVLDRIDLSGVLDSVVASCLPSPASIAASLLPSASDDQSLKRHFAILVSRILATHITFFSFGFDDVVQWHIQHEFSDQMAKKSVVVPLGVLNKNETKGDDMVDIMAHLHQYVPSVDLSEGSESGYKTSENVRFHEILIGGDQLTAARARSSKLHMANGKTPSERLEGLIPVAEDWHTKACLLGVMWKLLYSKASSSEHGTLYQLRNIINRHNVVKKPIKDFNACDDFFMTVLNSHIVVAAMKYLRIESQSQVPDEAVVPHAHDQWMLSKEERSALIMDVSEKIVDAFVHFQFTKPAKKKRAADGVEVYAEDVLSLGLFYWEYSDAIREGDGERWRRCMKYMLPIFVNTGRRNYSIEVLRLLYRLEYQSTPRQAIQLLYSRFINVHGLPGRNVAADLHMEHLNAIAKGCIKGLGANKTEVGIQRSARALGTIVPVLEQFDAQNQMPDMSGAHRRASAEKDQGIIVSELQKIKVFDVIPGRRHETFTKPKNVLHDKKSNELKTWITERL